MLVNEVMQLMKVHTSVRSFTEQTIDDALLQQIIECGQAASSSSFIQAYSIIQVVDPDKREIIARAAGNQSWIVRAAEFLVFCADMQRIQYCCGKTGEGQLQGYAEHFVAATVDTALMAQNVLLAAESAELGGVFIGGIRNQPQVVSECLELPELVYPVFGLCLGYPSKRHDVKPRMPFKNILHEDCYDSSTLQQKVDEYDQTMAEYYAARASNVKNSDWSEQTAQAIQGKKREHMKAFLQDRGFLLK